MERSVRWSPTRTLSLWTLIITTFNLAGLQHGPLPSVEAESVDTLKVSAVSGGEATLPCESRSPQPPDALLLVVWYKDDVPIYSYDGRVKGPSAHWADAVLDGRARWHSTPPSSLKIRDIVAGDRALYRCRVDFKVSPTRNTKIMLDVVELPEKPKVFDELNKEIDGVAGPYQEETSLKLTCIVSGGRPMPRLRWWRDDKVIATLAPVDDGSRISMLELRISKLSREFLDAVYTCTADNTPMVPPLRANVKIEIYLRPLLVEILKREQPLSVGQDVEIGCRAIGARPPAVITWWLDGKQLPVSTDQKNSSDGNETVSILHWTPRMEHDRRVLTCRASHSILERSTIETTLTLNLHYMPIVNLQLGAKLNPNDIEEGDDVYFDCLVRANPPAYKVVWEHNGSIMTHNQRAGVIAGSAHLALQGVSREQAGMYACTASNVEGDGRSQYVNLQVIYKPVCKNEPLIVGAPLNHSSHIKCEVDAFPIPGNFLWTLNTSTGMVEFDASKFTSDGQGTSILTYTPRRDSDYGSLACRSTNLAGQQIDPCRFTIIPGVKPEAPYNCTAVNLTDDSVELKCLAGYDGGLSTVYIAEAWSLGIIVANLSSPSPLWRLKTLGAGRSLKVIIFAENARGKSDTVVLRIQTLSRLAMLTVKDASGWDVSWALGTIAGMAGTLAIIAYLAIILRRRHRPRFGAQMQTVKGYKGSMHTANHSPMQPDDKNPDVVPLGKDFNCSRDTDPPPDPPPYGSLVTPPVGSSKSASSLHDARSNTPHTPNTPASDSQSIGTLAEDRRSVTSGTLSRRREVVTTRTPLLANARESCV